MTELRHKFENPLILRRYSPKTRAAYINAVKSLAEYYRRSPDLLSDDQVQDYLLYLLKEKRLAWLFKLLPEYGNYILPPRKEAAWNTS